MSKARRNTLIISIITLLMPVIGTIYSAFIFKFPSITFGPLKGILTVFIVLISITSAIVSLKYHDEDICTAIVIIEVVLCMLPYGFIAYTGLIPTESIVKSSTNDIKNYLVIDDYETDFLDRDMIFDVFPDIQKDKTLKLDTYRYDYACGLWDRLEITATFSSTVDAYPALMEKLEEKLTRVDDPKYYAKYMTEGWYETVIIDVKLQNDGTVIYSCYADND